MAATDVDKNSAPKGATTEADSARIGWAFLSQYYSYLNKDPARLHCFYTKRSTLIHSTEGEDSTPCYGQQEIHAKIMSLQFDDCKVYISNVDSQGSAEHGIIVQVIGEMSNANGPWRKFAQTFFLAEQLNGYFVLNDICRYIKEEGDEDTAQLPDTGAPSAAPVEEQSNNATADGEPASVQSVLFNETSTPPAAAPVSEQASAVQQNDASATQQARSQEQPAPPPGSADSFTFHADEIAANSAAADEPASQGPVAAAEDPTPAEAEPEVPAPPSKVEEPAQPEPKEPSADAEIQEPQPITAVEEKATPATEPAAAPARAAAATAAPSAEEPKEEAAAAKASEPAAPASAPTPKSWASLAAKNVTKWGGAVSQSKGTSAAPQATAAAENRSAASSSVPSAAGGAAAGQEQPTFVDAVLAVRQPQCFVKGVLETVSERLLRDTLTTRFGPLKEVDIVRSKACAFIEFEKLDHARRAIQASLRPNEGGEGGIMLPLEDGSQQRINIVERKPHSERPPATGRGGRGGSNAGAGAGQGGPGGQGGEGQGARGGYKGAEGGRGGRGASQGARGARGGRGGRGGAASGAAK